MMIRSIFASRVDFIPQKDGTLKEVPHEVPGEDVHDDFYYDEELIYVPQPVEGSDEDYILVPKLKKSKKSIQQIIDSQADDVGLDNVLRKYELTGDPSVLPSGVHATDDILDLTALPQDNAEYMQYIHNVNAMFESIPIELRKDMSIEDFVKSVTPEQVNKYFESLKAAQDIGKDKVKDGD